jgi:chlorobactene glucosyltransferase
VPLIPLIVPWVALLAFLVLRVRPPRELGEGAPASTPLVSVVVPARDEAVNIQTCLASLTRSRYPRFEIVVVDDRSDDGTGDRARAMDRGRAERLDVLDGRVLPEGWLGKPWACRQGADAVRGELILFTDADTVHAPELLERAVATMEEDRADLVTVVGVQLMETFWERLVQPQVFLAMALRFHDPGAASAKGRWRDAIANGQFLLFRRDVYEALGGHGAVRGEVVEDLALAQLVVARGHRLSFRLGEHSLATRMYRSLGQLVAGWSKNLMVGSRKTVPPALRPLVAPVTLLLGLVLWILPPLVLVVSLAGALGRPALAWSATATAVSAVFWMAFTRRMGAPMRYGLLYPLGASVGLYILVRSWTRGRHVEWKGRSYVVHDAGSEP